MNGEIVRTVVSATCAHKFQVIALLENGKLRIEAAIAFNVSRSIVGDGVTTAPIAL